MKKPWTRAAAIAALSILVSACGGGGGGSDSPGVGTPVSVGPGTGTGTTPTPDSSQPTGNTGSTPGGTPGPGSGSTTGSGGSPTGGTGTGGTATGSGGATGGGGSATDGGSGSTGGGDTSTGSGTVTTPQFAAFGPVTLASAATAPVSGGPRGPAVARLAQGGAVVAWADAGSLMAQQLDVQGQPAGAPLTIATLAPETANAFSVAGLAGGGWVAAWVDYMQPITAHAQSFIIRTRRYSASGVPLQDAAPAPTLAFFDLDPRLQVKGTPDGGYVLGYSASPGGPLLRANFLRFSAEGAPVGGPVAVSAAAGQQRGLKLVPLPDGTLVAVWLQGNASADGYIIETRRFDATGQPMGDESPLADSASDIPYELDATLLAGGNIAIAWALPQGTAPRPDQARWEVVTPGGTPVGTMGSQATAPLIDGIAVAPTATGFTAFVQVTTGFNRGTNAQVTALDISAGGALLGSETLVSRSLASVSPTTGATTGPAPSQFSIDGGSDGHYVAAYESGASGAAQVNVLGR